MLRRKLSLRSYFTFTRFGLCLLGAVILKSMESSAQIPILSCEGDNSCRCTFNDGTGTLDISSIGNTDGTARFTDAFSYDGNSFSFNPCFSFSTTGCSDAAVCQKGATGSYTLISKQSPVAWSFTGYYPMLTYQGSDGKIVEISMICDQTYTVPQLDVFGEIIPGTVAMNLWSKCACAGACERVDPPSSGDASGLTAGSIMLILFFSLLFVYLAAGVVINYHRKKTGVELVPNLTLWIALPGLIKEGFTFSWACIRGQNRRGGYESPEGGS